MMQKSAAILTLVLIGVVGVEAGVHAVSAPSAGPTAPDRDDVGWD